MVAGCVQVVCGFTVALGAALFGFWKCPNVGWVQWLSIASVGAALYGPQMIIGLCGAEVVSKSGVSSAQVPHSPQSVRLVLQQCCTRCASHASCSLHGRETKSDAHGNLH